MFHLLNHLIAIHCNLPKMPTNGKIRNYESYNHSLPENTNITFLCDDNFLPDKEYIATCNIILENGASIQPGQGVILIENNNLLMRL